MSLKGQGQTEETKKPKNELEHMGHLNILHPFLVKGPPLFFSVPVPLVTKICGSKCSHGFECVTLTLNRTMHLKTGVWHSL